MLWRLLGLVLVIGVMQTVWASEPIKIGVLTFRPKAQAQTQWQPLATALKTVIPDRDFVVETYTLTEMASVVASHQVDFVLTNPGQYVLLARPNGLQAPLATLLMDESGHETSAFGGVVFTRAGPRQASSLADLEGKTLAAVGKDSLGGYLMQAFEFQKLGIDLDHDTRLLITSVPQDKVVAAVLDGRADAGFVRTGLLEAMAREGKLDLSRIHVLNLQNPNNFPVRTSIPLYPEWPFSYLDQVDEHLARQVTAALFLIKEDSAMARTMGIRGFSVPADYTPVADLLKALRVPPFDKAPLFTLNDVVTRYRLQLLWAALALVSIALLGLRLWLTSRALRREQHHVLLQRQALAESEFRWKFAVEASGGGLWDWDVAAGTLFLADSWKATLGYGPDELSQNTLEWESRLHPDDRAGALAALAQCMRGETGRYRHENRVRGKDGSYKWVLELGQVVRRDAAGAPLRLIGIDTDITERKAAEEKLQLAASVFSHAREGITITNTEGDIIDVNEAFSLITGYSRDEVLGRNPRFLSSGRQSRSFYTTMYADLQTKSHWYGEVWNRRKSGEVYAQMLTISTVRDAHGKVTHYVAMFFDITALKAQQKQLEHIAHYDALTDLPNRVLLADRLHQAMVQAQRRRQLLAVA